MTKLRIEEMMLIKVYNIISQNGRSTCLAAMNASIPYLDDEDIKKETNEVIRKVSAMTDAEFEELKKTDLPIDIDEESPEEVKG